MHRATRTVDRREFLSTIAGRGRRLAIDKWRWPKQAAGRAIRRTTVPIWPDAGNHRRQEGQVDHDRDIRPLPREGRRETKVSRPDRQWALADCVERFIEDGTIKNLRLRPPPRDLPGSHEPDLSRSPGRADTHILIPGSSVLLD